MCMRQFSRLFQLLSFQYNTFAFTMPKSIPDRWEDYKPLGQAIEGTRFLPFKVPLKQILHETNQVPKEQTFTPAKLFEILAEKNMKLGLLIDLTFTRRYYNSEEITAKDVKYEKVFTAGHHVPNLEVVTRFVDVVKQFEKDNADNDLLIGVHCTHGVNRTGYLICRYMIEHLKFTPEDALKAYEKGRGYPVERKNYVDDLHTRPRTDEPEIEPNQGSDRQESKSYPRRNNYEKGVNDWKRRPYSNQSYYYQSRNDRLQGYDNSYSSGYGRYHQSWDDGRNYDYDGSYEGRYGGGYEERFYPSQQEWNGHRTRNDDWSTNQSRQSGDYYSDRRRLGPSPKKGYSQGRYNPYSSGYQRSQNRSRYRTEHQ